MHSKVRDSTNKAKCDFRPSSNDLDLPLYLLLVVEVGLDLVPLLLVDDMEAIEVCLADPRFTTERSKLTLMESDRSSASEAPETRKGLGERWATGASHLAADGD